MRERGRIEFVLAHASGFQNEYDLDVRVRFATECAGSRDRRFLLPPKKVVALRPQTLPLPRRFAATRMSKLNTLEVCPDREPGLAIQSTQKSKSRLKLTLITSWVFASFHAQLENRYHQSSQWELGAFENWCDCKFHQR